MKYLSESITRVLCMGFLLFCLSDVYGQCGSSSFKVLHYTETSGFNHSTREVSRQMFEAIGLDHNFTVTDDSNGDEFNSLTNLQQYALVIFSNTSGNNILSAAQRANFEAYIRSGGSYVGIHAASDTYRHSSANGGAKGTWDWYAENVAGCSVQNSPNHTSQNHNEDMIHMVQGHPVLAGSPDPWNKTEEYYYWENGYVDTAFTEVLRVQNTGSNSYDAARMTTHVKELAWGGRAFYTSLGHSKSNFTQDTLFQNLLTQAVLWTAAPNVSGGVALTVNGIVTDASCLGNDGKIEVSVFGGTGTYAYSWSNNSLTEDLTGLSAGTYVLEVDDGNGCRGTKEFTVVAAEPEFTVDILIDKEISCFGEQTGAIHAEIGGNVDSLTYLWNTGQNSVQLSDIPAGQYSVEVRDTAGCVQTASIEVSQPAALAIQTVLTASISCYGSADASLTTSVSGGVGPYTYAWNNAEITSDLTNLDAGTYLVQVRDSNLCTISDSLTITQPDSLELSLTQTVEILCGGESNGIIESQVMGGTGTYTYFWNEGTTSPDLIGVGAGAYVLQVQDANNCLVNAQLQVMEPVALSGMLTIEEEIRCFGESTGAVSAIGSGGVGEYTYLWTTGATDSLVQNLGAGTHVFTLTDENGCTWKDTILLEQPDPLMLTASMQQNASCNGVANGEALASAQGGTSPYTYQWSNGQTGEFGTGLSAGIYEVKVVDALGCSDSTTVSIANDVPWELALSISKNISCFGETDGEISSQIFNGTSFAPFTYLWSTGETQEQISGLSAESYALTATDKDGCQVTQVLNLEEPDTLQVELAVFNPISCFGDQNGSISSLVRGGSAPYNYMWNDGQSTATATNLGAGPSSVVVTDSRGCTSSQSLSLTEPDLLQVSLSETNPISCFGAQDGKVLASTSGGTGTYQYSWSNGQTSATAENLSTGWYKVEITDANNCMTSDSLLLTEPEALQANMRVRQEISCFGDDNGGLEVQVSGGTVPYTYRWNTGGENAQEGNLSAGLYEVVITDQNSCVIRVDTQLIAPSGITSDLYTSKGISCFGERDAMLVLDVQGGSPGYTFLWNDGNMSQNRENIGTGWHVVEIRDTKGCVHKDSLFLAEPNALQSQFTLVQHPRCFGEETGAIRTQVSGGSAPFTYAWSSGGTGANEFDLAAGMYTVSITDRNNCTVEDSVLLTEPPAIQIELREVRPISCFGEQDASWIATASGGVGPYEYVWSNGQQGNQATGLGRGNYALTVTDSLGCKVDTSIFVVEPLMLNSQVELVKPASCESAANGAGRILVGGGTMPYQYIWNNGIEGDSLQNALPGMYSVNVVDARGCSLRDSLQVEAELPWNAEIIVLDSISCLGKSDGRALVQAEGVATDLVYLWSHGHIGDTAINLEANMYSVVVEDEFSCSQELSLELSAPATMEIFSDVILTSPGESNGTIRIDSIARAQGPFLYSWSTGDTTAIVEGLGAGVYEVQIEDVKGCLGTIEIEVDTNTFVWDSFEAVPDYGLNSVRITWTSLQEKDNMSFSLERSLDNLIFETYKSFPSQGDSDSLQSYVFFDETPLNGKSFYRMKQIHRNGKISYFPETREVDFNTRGLGFVQVYPVPQKPGEDLTVELALKKNTTAYIALRNSLHQTLFLSTIPSPEGRQLLTIPTESLLPGIYYVIVNNDEEVYSRQVIMTRN